MSDDVPLKDLKLTRRSFGQGGSDRDNVDLIKVGSGDLQTLQTVSGRANLAQAIINRLFTRKGELTKLGHPNYGSRLHKLIGEPGNARTMSLAEIYIRESLAQERRIEEITGLSLAFRARRRDRNVLEVGLGQDVLEVTVGVRPLGGEEELTISIPINLGG